MRRIELNAHGVNRVIGMKVQTYCINTHINHWLCDVNLDDDMAIEPLSTDTLYFTMYFIPRSNRKIPRELSLVCVNLVWFHL